MVRQGVEIPLSEKRQQTSVIRASLAKSILFSKAADQYIDAHKSAWKNAKHIDQWRNTLDTYAYPIIGKIEVSMIDANHIMRILKADNLWNEKTETASRVRGRIESVLDWATVRKYRSGENPARWKRPPRQAATGSEPRSRRPSITRPYPGRKWASSWPICVDKRESLRVALSSLF